jgi:hypothetical protein
MGIWWSMTTAVIDAAVTGWVIPTTKPYDPYETPVELRGDTPTTSSTTSQCELATTAVLGVGDAATHGLLVAIDNGDATAVAVYLEAGGDVRYCDNLPLRLALTRDSIHIVMLLREYGASLGPAI